METIPLWKTIFLGAIQGLTEFLPVSSSAHLVIFQQYLGLGGEGSFLMALDVALHFGTLLAILVSFHQDIPWLFKDRTGRKVFFYLILATIPAAVIGFFLKGFFETLFADVIPVSFFLMITGWFLWLTKKMGETKIDFDQMKGGQAWVIGLAQALAILPGISRSGATIATGLTTRLKGETAVKFSFLMAIPAIAGATLLEAHPFAQFHLNILFPILVGCFTSFGVGLVAIQWVLKIVQKRGLYYFSWYCWAVGGFVFIKELFF